MHIGIVGGSLEGLLLAIELAPLHDCIIFDIEPEIGTPSWNPGWILDPSLLETYLSLEQIEFMLLHENPQGWGFRWEWLIKHLSVVAAQRGVQLRTRTRILNTEKNDDGIDLQLSITESQHSANTFVNVLIDVQNHHESGVGTKQHNLNPDYLLTPFYESKQQLWFGGLTTKKTEKPGDPQPILILQRSDGLKELWWDRPISWRPKSGFIEETKVSLPDALEELSFDAKLAQVVDWLRENPELSKSV
ncbi:MAG: hypothetical protein L7S56_06995 [Candidatus Poseidonia sp.]|nr:hypothetical protein [Poseidonia sp.]